MPIITQQELIDAQVDAQKMEDIVNGSESFGGTGFVTTRLGTVVRTLKKVIQDVAATKVNDYLINILNLRLNDYVNIYGGVETSLRRRIEALEAARTTDYYVDPDASDSNNGLTFATAKKTLNSLISTLTGRQVIGLTTNKVHPLTSNITTTNRIKNVDVVKVKSGNFATLDLRKDLSANTWTLNSGTVWQTNVTFRDEMLGGGSSASTAYHGVWVNDVFMEWMVGGANIAANIASVIAKPGSFTIHANGSSNQDPRVSTLAAGTVYVVYLNMPDASNPNTKNVKIIDQNGYFFDDNVFVSGVRFTGNAGKDLTACFNATGTKVFQNCEFNGFGCHGHVGPAEFHGCKFLGNARKGMALSGTADQTFSGINLFYAAVFPREITLSDLEIANTVYAIFGHGIDPQVDGYPKITFNGIIKTTNCVYGINWGFKIPITQVNAYCDFRELGTCAFSMTSHYTNTYCDGGGFISMKKLASSGRANLVDFGNGNYIRLKNYIFQAGNALDAGGFAQTFRLWDGFYATDTANPPTLELDGCIDVGWKTTARFVLNDGSSAFFPLNAKLILSNGTILGNLSTLAAQTNFPKRLDVGAGCQFGFGDRTGPQIEAALTAAGIPFSISGQTTIVNRDGSIASNPGWK